MSLPRLTPTDRPGRYVCKVCGARLAEAMGCTGCCLEFYCGEACQAKAWCEGHSKFCARAKPLTLAAHVRAVGLSLLDPAAEPVGGDMLMAVTEALLLDDVPDFRLYTKLCELAATQLGPVGAFSAKSVSPEFEREAAELRIE